MKNILFILPGLPLGGIETYIVRLCRQINKEGVEVDVLLLSNKKNKELVEELGKYANIITHNYFPLSNGMSWFNALIPVLSLGLKKQYYTVHAVDLLCLYVLNANRNKIKFDSVSVGLYHGQEAFCWINSKYYFSKEILELFRANVNCSMHFNECSLNRVSSMFSDCTISASAVFPLGINLDGVERSLSSFESNKIVSIGRLVNFKTYNFHVISILSRLREYRDFEYYIYGDGPEKDKLIEHAINNNVENYVHFMGSVCYSEFKSVLEQSFCFVGSGTAIIEASAAGIPSIVGVDSIKKPDTSGFFSDVSSYSYNEYEEGRHYSSIFSVFETLLSFNDYEYSSLCNDHIKKARCFDIKETAKIFFEVSGKYNIFNFRPTSRALFFFSMINGLMREGGGLFSRRYLELGKM